MKISFEIELRNRKFTNVQRIREHVSCDERATPLLATDVEENME